MDTAYKTTRRTKAGQLAELGMLPKAFNTLQAAALAGLSTDTYRELCAAHGIEGRRVSKTLILYTESDIDLLLARLPRVSA